MKNTVIIYIYVSVFLSYTALALKVSYPNAFKSVRFTNIFQDKPLNSKFTIVASLLLSADLCIRSPNTVFAADITNTDTVSGVVLISEKVPLSKQSEILKNSHAALYLTARQDNGVWQDNVRNFKQPPILAKKISNNEMQLQFPLDFTLNKETDSTPEGLALSEQQRSGMKTLLISARFDMDGVAATRSPDDLVGQASTFIVESDLEDGGKKKSWKSVELTLEGRGVTGKLITSPIATKK